MLGLVRLEADMVQVEALLHLGRGVAEQCDVRMNQSDVCRRDVLCAQLHPVVAFERCYCSAGQSVQMQLAAQGRVPTADLPFQWH